MSASSFFGRQQQLGELRGHLELATSTGAGRLVAVRGRRQVGKSRLIEEFTSTSGVPYGAVSGLKGSPVAVQMRRAVETLRSSAVPLRDLDAVLSVPPSNWYDLLSRLPLALRDGPAVLVIDEFPWAEETNPGLSGLIQSLWDQELSREPILVILIGSDEAMMDRLFEHDRPLFGRLDAQLVVDPFNPFETSLALGGSRSAVEVFDTHLVTGGFPELVAHARQFETTRSLLEDGLSRPHTLLADVAQITLAGELADGLNARLVLNALGADEIGVMNFSRIVSNLGGDKNAETAVVRAVAVLVESKRLVAIDLPAGNRNARLRHYRITDPYLRCWYRFIEPHLHNVEVGRPDLAISDLHRSWSSWRGRAIEPIVRQAVLRLAPRLDAPFKSITSIGGWWDRKGDHEYDLVGTDRSNEPVALGSVKWREGAAFDASDLADLATGRSVIPRAGAARLVAVAPRGVAPGVGVDLVLDASALLSAWRP